MLSPLQSIALMACRVIWRQQLVQATTQATTCLSSPIPSDVRESESLTRNQGAFQFVNRKTWSVSVPGDRDMRR